jgi:outer membrane protein TolC
VDLIASRSKSDSENNVSINNRYDTTAVGVQVTIPLFAGGYVNANVRQAEAKKRQAQQDLESMQRKISLETRQSFNSINTGIAQIKAYEQAVASNETALESTRKSVKAGVRSNVDILNAQQQLYSSRRDLARSRYQYILNWLKLKSNVGTLGDEDVQMASSWLSAAPNSAD